MYECTWCGTRFDEEDAGKKYLNIRIHGEEEIEDIDVCPCCRCEEIVEVEDEEEEADNEV